jgi:hypothetical protein
MTPVSLDVYLAAHRFGVVSAAGGRVVRPIGTETDAARSEFAAGGEVIARRVGSGGAAECWLRTDLVELAETALAYEAADTQRVISEVTEFAEQSRREAAARPAPRVSLASAQAAIRHSKRIGRYWDMNARGDAERARLLNQLANAKPNDEGEGE